MVYTVKLRLLHLFASIPSSPVSGLSQMVHLVYLGISLHDESPARTDAITSALGHMPHLRVLVIDTAPPARMLRALPEECPQLQHLKLDWRFVEPLEPLTRMDQLISIELRPREKDICSDWNWLEAIASKGLLEYLNLGSLSLPFGLACRVIKQCEVSRRRLEIRWPSRY